MLGWKVEGAQNEGGPLLIEETAFLSSGAWRSPQGPPLLRRPLDEEMTILDAVRHDGAAVWSSPQRKAAASEGLTQGPERSVVGTGKLRGQRPQSNCDGPGNWPSGAGSVGDRSKRPARH